MGISFNSSCISFTYNSAQSHPPERSCSCFHGKIGGKVEEVVTGKFVPIVGDTEELLALFSAGFIRRAILLVVRKVSLCQIQKGCGCIHRAINHVIHRWRYEISHGIVKNWRF